MACFCDKVIIVDNKYWICANVYMCKSKVPILVCVKMIVDGLGF
jgi:hypothetical protein